MPKVGPTRLKKSGADYFDLTPDDEQKMIVDTVSEFAEEVMRPAAHDSDHSATYPPDLVAKAAELGVTAINVPEDFEGIAAQRAAVTNVLVAEALAYGDMGLALPILAPAGVASALTHWGSADQQATYLKEFAGENVPQACVAISEPHPLFDPTALKTTAVRTPSGYRLDGVKSLVPAAANAELLIVAAQLNGKPALFIVESSSKGLTVTPDPSMGIRAAALGQIELDHVTVPLSARLGEERRRRTPTTRRPSRCRASAGPHWRSARRTRCSTTWCHMSRSATHSVSRSRTARRWRSCAPTWRSSSTVCG